MARRRLVAMLLLALLSGCGLAPSAARGTLPVAARERGSSAASASPAARPSPLGTPTTAPPSPMPSATAVTPGASATVTAGSSTSAAPSSTPGGAWLTLLPASGPPGTAVTVSGYVPTPPPPAAGPGLRYNVPFVTVCWAGCADGIDGQATAQWSTQQPNHFTLRFVVPPLPWMGHAGPHPLTPGAYAVSVECLTPPSAGQYVNCPPPLTATFRLTGPPPTRCVSGPCGQLRLAPTQGPPGTLVQVTGWAPLFQLPSMPATALSDTLSSSLLDLEPAGGASRPVTSAEMLAQAPDGRITGTLRVPADDAQGVLPPGRYAVVLRHGQATMSQPFTVTAAPSWAALGPHRLLWSTFAGFAAAPLAVDPTNPARLAACVGGGVRVSADGGATWTTFPTGAVDKAAAALASQLAATALGHRLAPVNTARCLAVALDPSHPTTLYAAFVTAPGSGLLPPPMAFGFVTTDQGRSWRAVPAPPGYAASQFGGWRVQAGGIAALFHGPERPWNQAPALAAELTTDGGQTWAPGRLACPLRGPCVAWGPATLCFGMGAPCPQWVETSTDRGATWAALAWPGSVDLRPAGVNELAALSNGDALVLTASGDFPLRRSADGGRTWTYVALPPLPGADLSVDLYPGLQLLPDGALLAWSTRRATWELLPPGASAWCTTAAPLPSGPAAMQAIGGQLWWIAGSAAREQQPASASLASVRCGPTGGGA